MQSEVHCSVVMSGAEFCTFARRRPETSCQQPCELKPLTRAGVVGPAGDAEELVADCESQPHFDRS